MLNSTDYHSLLLGLFVLGCSGSSASETQSGLGAAGVPTTGEAPGSGTGGAAPSTPAGGSGGSAVSGMGGEAPSAGAGDGGGSAGASAGTAGMSAGEAGGGAGGADSPPPLEGTPLPAVIEAEDFDEGPAGTAYQDSDVENTGGSTYRTSEVDIREQGDLRFVDSITEGEWLAYTVAVTDAGEYDLDFRFATAEAGAQLSIEIDGVAAAQVLALPATGSLETWGSAALYAVDLSAGTHVIRVRADTPGFVFDRMNLRLSLNREALPGWKIIWAEEFDYDGAPDPAKWNVMLWPPGMVNMELQEYVDRRENLRVEGGRLIIEGRNENGGYTSGRIEGQGKFDFTYGRVEIRAQAPIGAGTWAAVWLMGTDQVYGPWPASGEMDVFEYVGRNPNRPGSFLQLGSYNYMMTNDPGRGLYTEVPTANSAVNLYGVEWYEDRYVPFAPGNSEIFVWERGDEGPGRWPFDVPFYFIVNMALGGGYGGAIDDSALPARFYVDSIRVFQEIP